MAKKKGLPKELTTVTTVSKTLALIMFIALPVIGFLYGQKYQSIIDNANVPSQTPQVTLVPTDSQFPVASACSSSTGKVVTITVPPDFVPNPRCAKVTAYQSLEIINKSGQLISSHLGQYKITIPSGQRQSINAQFGSYLAPGVHDIHLSPSSNAEIWLQP